MPTPLVYRRYGGSLQVHIPHFEALLEAIRIPETQWMATACPLEGFNCDPRFLSFMDTDSNGRVRVAEVRAAVEHTARLLQSRKGVDTHSDVLELSALSPEAAPLLAAARRILGALKAPDLGRISLEQVRASEPVLRAAGLNGDGIVSPTFLSESVRDLASRIMAAFPEVKNRAGQPGIDPPTLQRFREARTALLAHMDQKDALHVWGEQSLERAHRAREVKPLLEEYFLQCRLVAAQPEAAANLRLPAGRVEGVLGDTSALEKAAAALPIAPMDPSGVLTWERLHRGPAFEALEAFRHEVATPVTGDAQRLHEPAWRALSAQAEAVLAWHAAFEANPVRGMLAELPSISDADLEALEAACQADLALKPELEAVTELERLLLYQRWLLVFANNFISMPDLYSGHRRALFEKGTLILGGRKYTLSVLAHPRAAHAALASQGTTCILYIKVTPKEGGDSYEAAVPVTRGRSAHLESGKRGIFYDIEGKEFDALVTQVIRQPVSLWEAMTMPFERIGRFISSRVEALAASGDKAFAEGLEQGYARATELATSAAAASTAAEPKAPPAQAGGMAGLVAAGGIAFAAIGSALAFIVAQAKALTLGDVLSAALIIAAIVMVPAGLLGWLKLRRRNLALLLEGSGWALNDRLMLTRDLAALLTRKPRLPKGATVDFTDKLRAALHEVQGEQGKEQEGLPLGAKLLVALALLLALLWQLRGPAARFACGRHWLSPAACSALLPSAEQYSIPQPTLAPLAPNIPEIPVTPKKRN